jgi:hypothetical protein
LVETIRKLGLAKAPLAEKLGFTPPSRAAPMAVGYANSRHDRPYGLREPAVIKVNRTRAKTVEVDEDASKPTDRADDKPAGLLIGRNGHPQRSSAQALDNDYPVVLSTGIELEITNCRTPGIAGLFCGRLPAIQRFGARIPGAEDVNLFTRGRSRDAFVKSSFHQG